MGDLFGLLKSRVDANARRAVEVYARELSEYRTLSTDTRKHAAMLDFAVLLRRRTAELAEENQPLSDDDLAFIAATGADRAHEGVSLTSHRQVLGLHSTLTVQEIHEAAEPGEPNAIMGMLSWVGPQGKIAGDAYTRGFLEGQQRLMPTVKRVQQFTRMLLAGDMAARHLAQELRMPTAEHYAVTVTRITGSRLRQETRDELIEILLGKDRMPMTWHQADEFVMLVPTARTDPVQALTPARERALVLARFLTGMTGQKCAIGAATESVRALATALALARQVSRAAPVQDAPTRVCTATDVFIELGTAHVPQIDRWLRDVARKLTRGPDLVTTLDAYYRHDMNRLLTAAALHIHPRTLDYRIHRVQDLTGINPSTTHGVRTLSTVIGRVLAGGEPE
jgi:hypothetical protein